MAQKITIMEGASTNEAVFQTLHPIVARWFKEKFGSFTEAQLHSMIPIRDRKNILVSSPTGSGKTLSAFGSILNYLIDLDEKKELQNKVYAVYVSPLKALTRDIEVNLKEPLAEMEKLAGRKFGIRVAVRTSDTPSSERQKMLKKSPHILICTPETLAIVLTTKKFVENFNALEYVVVDEVHALSNKRGTYLSLTLERLNEYSLIEPVRIGLSATIAPITEVAKFLVGSQRDCLVADVKLRKSVDIGLISPSANLLEAETSDSQKNLYRILDELISDHKTTLIFTNTRSATERIIHHLDLHFPHKYRGLIGAHHSSMSRETRFEIEDKLRSGKLKVVVSSTSLELGIDIGNIDLVVLLRSPKGVSRALQRIGRAGHKLHETPKGRFVVMDRDDLVECAVLMKDIIEKRIDTVEFPKNALDVLAQQIFGMAISKIWKVDEMLAAIRRSYCYSDLSKDDFFDVISYLSGEYALEHRHVYAKIWYDVEKGEIGKRGMLARLLYMTNIGTIPEEGFIEVVVQSPKEKRGGVVGKIDEAFLERMKRGDVFVLGGQKYQFMFSRGMKAYVIADIHKNPTIPSWFSEMLPLSFEVALDIGRLRTLVKERIDNREICVGFIMSYLYCSRDAAENIYTYMREQYDFSALPDDKTIVVEKFKNVKEYLLFHSMYGRKVNDALSRAYAFAAARLKMRDIEIGINDYGFYIAGEKLEEDKIIDWVKAKDLEAILKEAIEKTDVLQRRFRHCAGRSLMILRSYKGRSKSVGRQQVHSHFLLAAVRKISNEFPILREARREVFEDLMDVKNAKRVLEWIESGKVKVYKKRTPLVSPFGLTLIMQSHADLIKMEDRAAFLKRMHALQMKVIGK